MGSSYCRWVSGAYGDFLRFVSGLPEAFNGAIIFILHMKTSYDARPEEPQEHSSQPSINALFRSSQVTKRGDRWTSALDFRCA